MGAEVGNALLSGDGETGAGDLTQVAVDKGFDEDSTLLACEIKSGSGGPFCAVVTIDGGPLCAMR